ncbi:amidohydrolase family protein [Flexithrix dorotheae]|uniref:amidohydrolase family protein n=1 Tax=Flexithrix dorotheae TaxID=70993 RepID=UPI00035CA834|nr:amidohydrolase family protein [Flexithrix dorotheae]
MKNFISSVLLIFLISSCNEEASYYKISDFEKVTKTDVHVHIHTERLAFYDQAKNDNFKLLTIGLDSHNKEKKVREQYAYSVYQVSKHPEEIQFATAFTMEGWDEPNWLERQLQMLDSAINNGARAVKVWKNIGMVYRDKDGELIMVDNPKLDPIFQMLADRKIPVIGHLGEPKNCWLPLNEMTTNNDSTYYASHPQYHMFLHPELPSYEDQIVARDKMLEKNPNLIFIGAHLGSMEWDVDEIAKRLDKFPNMAVETAARMGQVFYQTHHDREKVRDFFIKYHDRVLYATDLGDSGKREVNDLHEYLHNTWLRDWRFFVTDEEMTSDLVDEPFQGLKLPKEIVDDIYLHNAQKWFKIFN